jgi:hypothetical protein
LVEFARCNRGLQAFVVDPEFDPDGRVPGWGVRGFYPVTADGDLETDGWTANPHYRPGPLTRGWPRPRNRLDRALQLTAAGHQPEALLLAALAAEPVVVATVAGYPDQVPVIDDHGRDTINLFTAEDHLHPDAPRVTTTASRLVPLLSRVTVRINPGLVPSVRLLGTTLASVITRETAVSGPGTGVSP